MSDIYAMRRANGDWFAVEGAERLRVPLFHSSHDATMARLRNLGMQLFHPVVLDARLLNEIVPAGSASYVDFSMVDDPFASIFAGKSLKLSEIEMTMNSPVKPART